MHTAMTKVNTTMSALTQHANKGGMSARGGGTARGPAAAPAAAPAAE